jgi:hypothetical protein
VTAGHVVLYLFAIPLCPGERGFALILWWNGRSPWGSGVLGETFWEIPERVGILFEGSKWAEAALQRLFLGVLGLFWGCFGLFREFFNELLTSGTGFGIITNSSDESKDKAVEAKRAL